MKLEKVFHVRRAWMSCGRVPLTNMHTTGISEERQHWVKEDRNYIRRNNC